MKFIGFNFNKINIEKFSGSLKELKINTKIDISKIEAVKSDLIGNGEGLIMAKFTYKIIYEPNIANIELNGDVFLSDTPKNIKEIVEQWSNNKEMPEDFRVFLFNIILRKSNLKALQLEDEMNLPVHIPFPSLKKEKNEKEKK